MNQALNLCIADLYQIAQTERQHFRERALERVQAVLQFKAGVWANGSHIPHRVHTSYVFNMSARLMELYDSTEIFVRQDFVRTAAVAKPDHPVMATDIHSRQEFEKLLTYKLLCRPLGIEQALAVAHLDVRSGLFDYLALWRSSKTQEFTEDERERLALLWPHLLAADALWLRQDLMDAQRAQVARQHGMFDQHGVLRVADAAMLNQLARDWPSWTGPTMPRDLFAIALTARKKASTQTFQCPSGTLYSVEPYTCPSAGPAFKLSSQSNGVLALLTATEVKIATLYAQGQTHKETAQQVGLSPGTVRNHVQTILHKLGLRNKTELSVKLLSSQV